MYPFDVGARERLTTSRDELEALVADVLAATAPEETTVILMPESKVSRRSA
jgi:hypothetical protein